MMNKIFTKYVAVKKLRFNIKISIIVLACILCMTSLILPPVLAQENDDSHLSEESHGNSSSGQADVAKMALLAAAIAFGAGAIGAGYAISHVGAAAMGAVAEKPEIGGQALIFIALAEGLVVFGFITALMILGKV
jgi:V/A-type H+/Na+-transporting ATPase subunit K